MNNRKIIKIIGLIALLIVILMSTGLGYLYYKYEGRYNVNSDKYPYHVGHIDAESTIINDSFELCEDAGIVGTYSSSAPKIYKGSKYSFKQKILSKYQNNEYPDTGYLNLRFHINCNGEIGDMEVNELNLEFERIDLADEMVEQLIKLTHSSENWDLYLENANYYMYLIYNIENGEIVEILP
ncbi:hypothetical protein [Joostella sp. CR20]|uniref:hypothetical protein n=1 Tax=Joostella sp. CR20 TaxID=2804312 RepID=UPI00313EEC76